MKTYLYLIKLEKNRYYVGSTTTFKRIRKQCKQSKGASQWVKKNVVDSLVRVWNIGELEYREAEIIETLVTVEVMKLVGILNVRGGFFTLTDSDSVLKTVKSHFINNRFMLDNVKQLELDFLNVSSNVEAIKIVRHIEEYLESSGIFAYSLGNDLEVIV
ncbi:hypothetical protein [Enterococcus faecalis]|uniref:hypothetical protein n=1 Tax=Enterococcus faecalis TaxID=1351 RepID=UPI001BE10CF3|nr:hypothetical protein [Enterococcus faecalis]HAP3325056.1 hypothetical protein [Enterococcus faecalis]